jgi:hypothetical protein
MEHSGATPADVITQSLEMVADCAAYILLISHKYGQTPKDRRARARDSALRSRRRYPFSLGSRRSRLIDKLEAENAAKDAKKAAKAARESKPED